MIDLQLRQYGLETPKQIHVHNLLHDYDERLSLRRIAPDDPVLNFTRLQAGPPHEFGVWEDNVAPGQRPWVFTVPAMSIDERLLARIIENDLKRTGASERMARLQAHERARLASQMRAEMERREERHAEQMAIGDLARRKDVFRHTFADGTTKIIGNDAGMRDVRSTPKANRTIRFAGGRRA